MSCVHYFILGLLVIISKNVTVQGGFVSSSYIVDKQLCSCCSCEITAQGCDDAGAAPGGCSNWPAVLGDENHSGLCCRDICRCFHQGT